MPIKFNNIGLSWNDKREPVVRPLIYGKDDASFEALKAIKRADENDARIMRRLVILAAERASQTVETNSANGER